MTTATAAPTRTSRSGCLVVLVIAAIGGYGGYKLIGPGSGSEYVAPASFVVSNAAVAQATNQAIANNGDTPGIHGQATATCAGQRSCFIAYAIKTPVGISNDLELIAPTRQVWKAMFSDPSFRSGTMLVSGPTTSTGGVTGDSPLFRLTCNRAASDQIDWDNVTGGGMRTLCRYTPLVAGL